MGSMASMSAKPPQDGAPSEASNSRRSTQTTYSEKSGTNQAYDMSSSMAMNTPGACWRSMA